jgi:hypothetical protein
MTWTIKVRGAITGVVQSEYRCPVHGVFEAIVQRDENGDPPDVETCPVLETPWFSPGSSAPVHVSTCGYPCPWTMTQAPPGRVRATEVVRGKADPAPTPHALDTRALAEGMDLGEFKERRARMWNDVEYKQFKEDRR